MKHPRLLKLSGILIPFVVHTGLKCFIAKNSKITLKSRLHFGNKKLLSLSAANANLQVGKRAQVDFGRSVSIGPGVNIIVKPGAKLVVGDNTYFTSDAHIESNHDIRIGSDCAISWGVTIIDSDHHELQYHGRIEKDNRTSIGDQVWIGCNVLILKGTVIGKGSVVAAGSVISGNFPGGVLIGGNPAKILRENIHWK